jgi:hypothetical protein
VWGSSAANVIAGTGCLPTETTEFPLSRLLHFRLLHPQKYMPGIHCSPCFRQTNAQPAADGGNACLSRTLLASGSERKAQFYAKKVQFRRKAWQ